MDRCLFYLVLTFGILFPTGYNTICCRLLAPSSGRGWLGRDNANRDRNEKQLVSKWDWLVELSKVLYTLVLSNGSPVLDSVGVTGFSVNESMLSGFI